MSSVSFWPVGDCERTGLWDTMHFMQASSVDLTHQRELPCVFWLASNQAPPIPSDGRRATPGMSAGFCRSVIGPWASFVVEMRGLMS